jgi:GTPase
VETVGVGQSEAEIAECADLVVLCVQPGSGDALQFMKAGVMEVPDLVLVTKGDLGEPARRALADVRGALGLAAAEAPEAALVSARTGEGIAPAIDRIAERVAARHGAGVLVARRRAQGLAWAESRLIESFGTVGHRLLAPRITVTEGPFTGLASLSERARAVLHESFKEL